MRAIVPSGWLAAAFCLTAPMLQAEAAAAPAPGEMRLQVVDAETGQGLPGVKVRAWVRTNLFTDASGTCSFPLPHPESERFSYRIMVTKEGYAGKYLSWSQGQGDKIGDIPSAYTVKLERGVTIGGVVVNEKGEPVPGARVIFSAPPDDNAGRERGVATYNYHAEHTDAEGRWHNGEVPRDFHAFVFRVQHPDYLPGLFGCEADPGGEGTEMTALSSNELLAGTAKMALGHGIEVAGVVTDAAGKPVAGAAITRNHEWRNPAAVLTTEDDGRFRIVNLRPGEMILTFQASGLEAQTRQLTLSNQIPELKIEMARGRIFRGRVMDESGQPIPGANVQTDRIPQGPLEYDWSTATGEDGRFLWDSAPEGSHPYYITADGFHSLSEPALVADGMEKIITLRKAHDGDQTVISGTVRDATTGAPVTNFVVRVKEFTGGAVSNFQMKVSNTNGNYAVGIDPAATFCQLVMSASGHLASDGENLSPGDGDQRVDVELLPGSVRAVVGKFTVPGYTGTIDWTANQMATLLTVVPPPEIATTDRATREKAFEQFLDTDKGMAWQRAHRSFDVAVDGRGQFRIEDVPAGMFELRANVRQSPAEGGETIASLTTQFAVSESAASEVSIDMGTVSIPLKKILKPNDTAPSFEVKTVEGQPLRMADFRGKYLLLDFWATWCGPCVGEMPNLKSTYEAFGANNGFAMVSLSLDSNPAAPKAFAQKNGIKWTQGFLGNWPDATAAKAYGVEAIPAIFLIGPDGKIIERNLRGEEIRAAVARALANQR